MKELTGAGTLAASASAFIAIQKAPLHLCSEIGTHCRTCLSVQPMLLPEATTVPPRPDASVTTRRAVHQSSRKHNSSREICLPMHTAEGHTSC